MKINPDSHLEERISGHITFCQSFERRGINEIPEKGKPAFSSLKQFSWSGKKRPEPVEELTWTAALEWYNGKRGASSLEGAAFVNFIRPRECPFCGSAPTRDDRQKDGIQRYERL